MGWRLMLFRSGIAVNVRHGQGRPFSGRLTVVVDDAILL